MLQVDTVDTVDVVRPARLSRRFMLEGVPVWSTLAAAVVLAAPFFGDDFLLYRAGVLVAIALAALGLHVLVNLAGELSLAHAAFMGAPALISANLASRHGLGLIPMLLAAVAVGIVTGAIVGLPSLRARGVQVALVTFSAAVAIDRFILTKSSLVGRLGGVKLPAPAIGPVEVDTPVKLYALFALVLVLAIALVRSVLRSKYGRAWLWLKQEPDAAAAAGVAVGRYRLAAYSFAGALAGAGGWALAVQAQRLTPQQFPAFELSFSFLLIVVLAGEGGPLGVLVAVFAVRGVPLFIPSATWIDYAGPLLLIVQLVRYPAGINGLLATLHQQSVRRRGGG
jgi:branched-chain amino acid transport system permease protein